MASSSGEQNPHMRIAYLVGEYPAVYHGYLLQEIRILRQNGIEVETASISPPAHPELLKTEEEKRELARTYYIKSQPKGSVLLALLAFGFQSPGSLLKGLRRALRLAPGNLKGVLWHSLYFVEAVLLVRWMERQAISHVHVSFSGTVGVLAKAMAPITMSWGVYGFGEVFAPTETRLAERVQASLFVRSISRHLRSLVMISCSVEKWGVLEYAPLGIDIAQYEISVREAMNGPLRVICVGRLAPEKGQRLLLDVSEKLISRGAPPFVLKLVGDGPDFEALKNEILRRGLNGIVELAGAVAPSEMPALYRESDISVLASLYEGIPTVLMEAMCLEVPCVAPRITGIPELIEDKVSGLLFTPTDLDEMTDAIFKLMTSPDLRQSIGLRARQTVLERYSIKTNTEKLAAIFRRYLQAS